MSEHIVAMIDGAMVGFATAAAGEGPSLDKVWYGATKDFPTFISALQHYQRDHQVELDQRQFAIAVAGIPRGDLIGLANCRWFVSVSGIRAFFRTEPLILNDYAATAWALSQLDGGAFQSIGALPIPKIRHGGTYLLVGTGSGLGMATLHITPDGQVVVLASEGGHASYAPQTAEDDGFLSELRRKFGHVSYERVVSADGLKAIAGMPGEADDIIAAARHRQPEAVQAMRLFAENLGCFVGSACLTVGAWDGAFLVGNFMQELAPFLGDGFRRQFANKGRLSKALQSVPTALVNHGDAQLLGAAAALAVRSRTA